MTRDTLSEDFSERFSQKKAALFLVLLGAYGERIRGTAAPHQMRQEHHLSVPDKPGSDFQSPRLLYSAVFQGVLPRPHLGAVGSEEQQSCVNPP
jgi:hypothetical protein